MSKNLANLSILDFSWDESPRILAFGIIHRAKSNYLWGQTLGKYGTWRTRGGTDNSVWDYCGAQGKNKQQLGTTMHV